MNEKEGKAGLQVFFKAFMEGLKEREDETLLDGSSGLEHQEKLLII